MARPRPPDRLAQIAAAAARVFLAKGYRRTQMADVAREMGVAPGTLYTYVAGKAALFDLVIERAFGDVPPPPASLPLAIPRPEDTLALLRQRLLAATRFPQLEGALARRRVGDAAAELEGIVRELYDRIEQTRVAAALMERSALDLPPLAALWFGEIRHRFFTRLAEYLGRRMRAGLLRPMAEPAVAARLVAEACSFVARHRHTDPDPSRFDDDAARETTVRFVVGALTAAAPRSGPAPVAQRARRPKPGRGGAR
jgi:AcrR family transcriptional regulator